MPKTTPEQREANKWRFRSRKYDEFRQRYRLIGLREGVELVQLVGIEGARRMVGLDPPNGENERSDA